MTLQVGPDGIEPVRHTTVLGIDPSLTNTGLAVLTDGRPTALHSIGWHSSSSSSFEDRAERILALKRDVLAWIDTHASDAALAVIEGPIPGGNTDTAYLFDRGGFWWQLYPALRRRKIPVAVVNPNTRPGWATGTKADKTMILQAVRQWYPRVKILNHDIADALIMALMGTMRADRSIPMPFLVKERHYNGLEAVSWPKA
ncbi:crossover junction endodeoxyribonuclease RuvC [Mycobacteroides abscessus]|uniref:crossover junction endodeoxyribonuclease RuvC n=1 Tax=Mycobacteroides abscessus TaxID=36809 RepID=UPI0005E3E569|nr:crossover junction endodeoxyribonuclease RuvC [Mycobacteroides abscessus]CPR79404.1 Holliday junction resolvase [Mycobacteroides abscessus]CPR88527.1 Holliday junction resolvase [Mycobacteroides abscessus]CPS43464.1 Holliday junction resolvase [Mycobacteroides abscessus]CPV03256.1 Holliday junction resolvase [Mycobacteroides abscessus]